MRVLIISDTHGRHRNFDKVLETVEGIDCILHLGDTEHGEIYMEGVAECPIHFVAGNNDFFTELPRDLEIELEGHKIFMSHGHSYRVVMGAEWIAEEGKRRGADIVLYGHTHVPFQDEIEGVLTMNPGSLSFPRPRYQRPSYIVMELKKGEKPQANVCYLES